MTLLITGGGLLGSQIAALAVEEGERTLICDINPQKEAIGNIVDLNKVDMIQGDVLDLCQIRRRHFTH